MTQREPFVVLQAAFEHGKRNAASGLALFQCAGRPAIMKDTAAAILQAELYFLAGQRDPLHDFRHVGRRGGQPELAAVFACNVNQTRRGIPDDGAIVVEHRHFAARVELEKCGLLVFLRDVINHYFFIGQVEQRKQDPDFIRISGGGHIIKLHVQWQFVVDKGKFWSECVVEVSNSARASA